MPACVYVLRRSCRVQLDWGLGPLSIFLYKYFSMEYIKVRVGKFGIVLYRIGRRNKDDNTPTATANGKHLVLLLLNSSCLCVPANQRFPTLWNFHFLFRCYFIFRQSQAENKLMSLLLLIMVRQAGGKQARLLVNWCSVPDVIEWMNDMARHALGLGSGIAEAEAAKVKSQTELKREWESMDG